MKYLFYLLMFVFVSSVIVAMICLNYLIKFQYKHYKAEWEKDGSPYATFGTPFPKFSVGTILGLTQGLYFNKLLFSTPFWITKNPSTKKVLYLLRSSIILGYLSIIVPFLFIIIYGIFINS